MEPAFENHCPNQANGLAGYYFAQLIQMLISTHCTIGDPSDYPKDIGNSVNELFDFIIVGGGSSGSVIANRLSDVKKWKVLLIESGGDPTFESDIPRFGLSLPGRALDWKFSVEQTGNSCLGMEDESCAVFQGKVLGGTSTINKMHYFRGAPEDYDEWEKLGNVGWGYEHVLRYFKKSEKLDDAFNIVSDAVFDERFEDAKKSSETDSKLYQLSYIAAGKYHSKAGSLPVNYFAYDFHLTDVKQAVFAAAKELNLGPVGDINRNATGFVRAMATLHKGDRGNAAKAFLSPVKDRKNLFVLKNATVHQLTFDGGRVTGVKFLKKGKTQTVTASKEVILSAGAINSPRLLMLSGIGPGKHLEKVGVKTIRDLPGVGQNLQTHLAFFGLPVVLKKVLKSSNHLQYLESMYQFISRGTGSFGNVGMNDVVGFISTKNEAVPDVEILNYFNSVRDYYTFNELLISLKIKNEIRDQFVNASSESGVLLICPTLIKPNSRGEIKLTGRNFPSPVKIHSNFLTDEKDLKTLIQAVRFVIGLTETEAFKKLEPEIVKLKLENCHGAFNTDEYWECSIRHLATSMHDAAGTCKMGPDDDPTAVVDDQLKVRGVEGLRVADSSIMPTIVRGSCSIAAVMIAEKVSDLIKDEWKKMTHEEL